MGLPGSAASPRPCAELFIPILHIHRQQSGYHNHIASYRNTRDHCHRSHLVRSCDNHEYTTVRHRSSSFNHNTSGGRGDTDHNTRLYHDHSPAILGRRVPSECSLTTSTLPAAVVVLSEALNSAQSMSSALSNAAAVVNSVFSAASATGTSLHPWFRNAF
jgi:hypothetical protein